MVRSEFERSISCFRKIYFFKIELDVYLSYLSFGDIDNDWNTSFWSLWCIWLHFSRLLRSFLGYYCWPNLSYPNHLSQAKRFCLWRAYILLVIFVILASIVGFSMSVLFGFSESLWNSLSPNTDLKLLSGFEAVALMGEPSCFYNKNNLYSIQQFKPFLSYAYELSGSLAVRDVSSIHR